MNIIQKITRALSPDMKKKEDELARIRKQNAERQRRWRIRQKGVQKLCPHCGKEL